MQHYRVVLDTNVIFAALDSKAGASRQILLRLAQNELTAFVSGLLFEEYRGVLHRNVERFGLTVQELDDFLDGLVSMMRPQEIHFQWRPVLQDPKDDMVLECAVAAGAHFLITFNTRDFGGGAGFLPEIVTPAQFLARLTTLQNQEDNPT